MRLLATVAALLCLAHPVASQPVVTDGQPVNGILEVTDRDAQGRYYDEFRYSGRRNERVIIDLRSTQFDAYVELRGESGSLVARNDNFGASRNARIAVVFPVTGSYVIRASSAVPGQVGVFTLRVDSPPSPTRPWNPLKPDVFVRPPIDKVQARRPSQGAR
jgi:hypothetical protein